MRRGLFLLTLALLGAASYAFATGNPNAPTLPENMPQAPRQMLAQSSSPVQTSIDPPAVPAPAPGATSSPAPAPGSPAPATAPRGSTEVDETALRYFAQQGDTERMQREIDRLRALHPGWQPPADPLAEDFTPDQDIVAIWELYSAGDFAGARAAIAAKQQSDPGFVPSPDLLQSLALGEASLRLRNASDAGENQTVISIAANNPQLLVCESIDNLWRLAEAFVATDAVPRALDAYLYILGNCTETSERFATMQKAIDLLDRADLEPLLALERTDAQGVHEFAGLRVDLARRSIAASLEEGGTQPLPTDVTLFTEEAEGSKNADDLRLLGYYELDRDRPNEARRMFEAAQAASPSAENAEALGVALLDLGEPEDAEAAIADYRDDNDTISALYLDIAASLLSQDPRVDLDEDVLGRIVDAAMSARNANVAQELGWYAYTFSQPQTASEWFTLALEWQDDLEPAAYGLMVSANALGNDDIVEDIRSQWSGLSERIAEFGRTGASGSASRPAAPPLPEPRPERVEEARSAPAQPVVQQAVQIVETAPAPAQGNSSAVRSCQNYVPAASLAPNTALSHAWCLMGLNRPSQAIDHFARALQSPSQSTRSDAAYGQSLAYVRLGLPDEASVAASSAPLTQNRAVELDIAILTQKATSAYNIGDYARALNFLDYRAQYAPERNDLLTLRAWSYFHLRRYPEAERIFAAVAATGYGDAVGGLEAARGALRAASQ